jgi:hypothetical protein
MNVSDACKLLKKKRNTEDSKQGGKTYHPTVPTINIYLVSYNNKRKILWIGRICLIK